MLKSLISMTVCCTDVNKRDKVDGLSVFSFFYLNLKDVSYYQVIEILKRVNKLAIWEIFRKRKHIYTR